MYKGGRGELLEFGAWLECFEVYGASGSGVDECALECACWYDDVMVSAAC